MVIAAGREIRDDDVVFVGMRLPLIAFAFAKRTHAPGAIGLFENGIVRDQPAPETLMTMSDTPNIPGALWCTGTLEIMALLQQGLVDLGFIGGAEIDRFGNLNTSYIGDWRRPKVRLPGSGGGADIASLARRFVVIMPQEKHRFRERVDYITSPGFGDGPGWRERVGPHGRRARRGGHHAGRLPLRPRHLRDVPGLVSPGPERGERAGRHRIRRSAWRRTSRPTPTPTAAELAIVRECDPAGFWTR